MSADVMTQAALVQHFDLIAQAPDSVARLRELILMLAVQGKLVPQDPSDEPASGLLKKIRAEKDRLIADGKIKRDKPLAKIADEENSFELPDGWEWVRLGEIVEVLDSLRKPVTKQDRNPGPYPYFGASGIVDYVSSYIFDEPLVLVGEDGAKWGAGDRTAFPISGKTWVNNHAHVLRPWRLAVMDLYLVHFLTAKDLSEFITGMTVPKLNQARLVSIPIALPPLAEQSRIITRVEELMQLCDALEASGQLESQQHTKLVNTLLGTLTQSETPEALADNWQRIATHFDLLLDRPEAVDALEQTILQLAVRGLLVPQDPNDEPASVLLQKIRAEKDHLISQGKIKRDKPLPPITNDEKPFELPQGWEWVRLQQAYDVRDGTHDTPKYQATGYPLVTSKNIYGGVLDLSDVKLISAQDHEQISARSKVDRNDILFAMIGSIGNPVLVDTDLEFSVKNVALFKYYTAALSCPTYLLLLLQTEAKGIRERAAGAVQSFVSLGQLRSAVVALPPLGEQLRIVTRVNELRALCSGLRAKLVSQQSTASNLTAALIEGA